jgi:hypothetical protein
LEEGETFSERSTILVERKNSSSLAAEARCNHETEKLSKSAAELFVKKVDKEMARAVRFIYGTNIDEPSAYELFFDVGVLPIHEVWRQ